MKMYTATVKLLGQNQGARPRERPFKARNPNLYYRSSHIERYYFCRQCKDHFDTAGVTGYQCVPLAALFFRNKIKFCGTSSFQ